MYVTFNDLSYTHTFDNSSHFFLHSSLYISLAYTHFSSPVQLVRP